ncbi:bifunctional tRNA (5-methylaminomethyl-2-thiouridine)(34)-methyltransferase MnmD/FAD-dependent 5-carboxymethylaminomethyl-2-thiouridine(34) oxidoreductase MnmC [Leptospira barantonii]|uniref:tRNA 5-methylaminomethyl-2-thiouridine biosynthesis bifunctional protein MnmC n=1 Tax=Leptospira barantonii TaxID=2023184 RepID=A0ABX4NP44_9LEPT|nr:bifunctional tRNA (5-methylaminomethyl-2-thiouridine)(34)-methyltransferase MnmD/FAD-dependent 5-carboxymethylaminomethyl-2-thiouridine(34) oxidoreductase MnmC [Leptospira barantonii]PJZ57475.1 bifunctional tRNA (5-methylaminomethyl-2-thiouridine)(34)-methyltransferase MnmD/FAD-dependent 5-carboxymethylaminomethyl-2-thiouridine(34) oxidoreductase MnmC [Leptospira barantonii]
MLSWKENSTPISEQFGDIYFSPENGLEETKHVFIQGNDLQNRWRNSNIQNSFCILELGFGTGLNFFTTWKEYIEHKDRFRLHFISIEKFPLNREEISKALSVFPELAEIKEEFLRSYEDLIPGMNYFRFLDGRIHFTLYLGDVADALREISGKVDAIFLDGFAPSKNPEMWQESTLSHLKNLSKIGTTFATFTVARIVRDSLTSVGFDLEKRPGFGRKREMLTGRISESNADFIEDDPNNTAPLFDKSAKPWCIRSYPKTQTRTQAQTVAIVGAGIAGSALAYSLSKRNIQVLLIDPSGIAKKASGIPGAISHPHITKIPGPISLFTLRAFRYALQFLNSFADRDQFSTCGLFHGITEEMNSERFQKGIENHTLSEEIVSWKKADQSIAPKGALKTDFENDLGEGIFFPKGFWTQPQSIAKKMTDQTGIEFIQATVTSIRQIESKSSSAKSTSSNAPLWELSLQETDRKIHADSVIFCNSHSIGKLVATLFEEEPFPIRKVRGQLVSLKETKESSKLSRILCAEHYFTPAIQGEHILGSTFDEFDLDPLPRKKDTEQLLQYLQNKYPSFDFRSDSVLDEKVGFRAQTPDRFPVIGPIFDPKEFKRTYKEIDLPKNAKKTYPALKTIPGLYVFGGLGSRGILSSFLGAEILASLILGEPAPVESSLLESLHPTRFLYRKIRKESES